MNTIRTPKPPIAVPIPSWLLVFGLILLFLFGFFGYVGLSQRNDRIVSGVYVGDLNLSGRTTKEAKDLLQNYYETFLYKPVYLQYGSFHPKFIPGDVGFSLDLDGMVSTAFRQGRQGNLFQWVMECAYLRIIPNRLPLKLKTDRGTLEEFYQVIQEKVNIEPVGAQLVVTPEGEVSNSPGHIGRHMNTERLTSLIQGAICQLSDRTIEIPVDMIRPQVMEEEVKKWSFDTVLGVYTTRFNPGAVDRSNNLRVAAVSINSCLVNPGEVFSFNDKVGPRVAEKGYREAPVIVKKKLVPGVGGGVCQVSGTLYNALLFAGFNEFGRASHSLPSSYLPMGRDATVVYGGRDFTFKNTLATPVLIVTNYNPDGHLTIAVMGKKTKDLNVKLQTIVRKVIPYPVIEESDIKLVPGQRKLEEAGKNGYKVELWRIWLDANDQEIRRELVNNSFYPPIPSLVKVGVSAPVNPPAARAPGTNGQP
ncbi:MAG TPA: VanW family protein [Bacillota bacterium]|nr:VanW family protein [Bacillota bacterium]